MNIIFSSLPRSVVYPQIAYFIPGRTIVCVFTYFVELCNRAVLLCCNIYVISCCRHFNMTIRLIDLPCGAVYTQMAYFIPGRTMVVFFFSFVQKLCSRAVFLLWQSSVYFMVSPFKYVNLIHLFTR